MVTRRDSRIILLLMINAALNAANTSVFIGKFVPPWVAALVGMLGAMISAATGVYVVATRESESVPPRGIGPRQ